MKTKAESGNMKKLCFISIAAFIMLSCMASSPQQSLQSRLFSTWAASGDEVTVLKIDKDNPLAELRPSLPSLLKRIAYIKDFCEIRI